jgi:YbgC/YbaW family acyl-CoA thioester hydrolase
MSYQHIFTIRFSQVDSAGIAFFSRVYEICHDAFEALLAKADMPLGFVIEEQGWGMPVVRSEADYAAPMRLGEEVVVTVTVERLGNSSVTFSYSVDGTDGVHRVRVRLTHAFLDTETFRARSVPESFAPALRKAGLEVSDPGT